MMPQLEFKFQIGDIVTTKTGAMEALEVINRTTTMHSLCGLLRVTERRSVECVGGTQLFYACAGHDGKINVQAEDALMYGDEYFTQWAEAFTQQCTRAKVPK